MIDEVETQLMLKVLHTLNEAQARWYVAKEALCMGRGGLKRMQEITRLSRPTILKGMRELRQQKPLDVTECMQLPDNGCRRFGELNLIHTPQRSRPPRRSYGLDPYRIRRPGGGRKSIEVKDPAIKPALEQAPRR